MTRQCSWLFFLCFLVQHEVIQVLYNVPQASDVLSKHMKDKWPWTKLSDAMDQNKSSFLYGVMPCICQDERENN